MLVLAIDTATPAVTAGVVELTDTGVHAIATHSTVDARAHAERITPHAQAALADAGIAGKELDAIVVGAGPGPYTGLRVGMVTAAALGHALDVPVHPVCSLDGIAHAVDPVPRNGKLLVATDARRSELYFAVYSGSAGLIRLVGPQVRRPAEIAPMLAEWSIASAAGDGVLNYADALGLPDDRLTTPAYPTPAGLVTAAAVALRTDDEPAELTPLYLRRPDAEVPTARKRVTR
ncbi:MAG: tRNA (adenosine(37)-N6)-threonylcarbamoyltransferase complex dimerization subunit type 1 TsaB [Sciscionella sp.]|nr:tRNA (adenosine(37)-N6)-threonylcarbamoyltransferase complex dimerization subunit type 1 TsaB [Sciscionella sp.]